MSCVQLVIGVSQGNTWKQQNHTYVDSTGVRGGRCYLAALLLLAHQLHQGCHAAVPHLHQGWHVHHTVLTSTSSNAKEFKVFCISNVSHI